MILQAFPDTQRAVEAILCLRSHARTQCRFPRSSSPSFECRSERGRHRGPHQLGLNPPCPRREMDQIALNHIKAACSGANRVLWEPESSTGLLLVVGQSATAAEYQFQAEDPMSGFAKMGRY